MSLLLELSNTVKSFAIGLWGDVPNGTVVPTVDDLSFSNSGKRVDATILYADISGSTNMVDTFTDTFAAELYKSFLHCSSKIIAKNNGAIQAYDGDRVMAVFIGDYQADDAVSTSLEIHFAVQHIINHQFRSVYGDNVHPLRFTVGIDSGVCLVVKVGVRAVGELAWIGPAANYAAKLNSFDGLDHDYPIRITDYAFARLKKPSSLYASNTQGMWSDLFVNFPGRPHRRTSFFRNIL